MMVAMNRRPEVQGRRSIDPGGYLFYDRQPMPTSNSARITVHWRFPVSSGAVTAITNRLSYHPRPAQHQKTSILLARAVRLLDMDPKLTSNDQRAVQGQ